MPDSAGRTPSAIAPSLKRIFVCTSNPGKLRDFLTVAVAAGENDLLLEPLPCLAQIAPPEEDGFSFEENARAKARYYSSFAPGLVLADDSGLEVDALNGAPGIHSARYSGPHATDTENNRLLLANLSSVTQPGVNHHAVNERHARFVCVLAVAQNGQVLLTTEGTVSGTILSAPKGTGGFGYDPLFFYPPFARSFGELTPEEKLSVSHRGAALRELFRRLPELRSA